LRGPALQAARRGNAPVAHWQRLAAAEPGWNTKGSNSNVWVGEPARASLSPTAPAYGAAGEPYGMAAGGHPFAEPTLSMAQARQAADIDAAFGAIEPTILNLAPRHFDTGFPELAKSELRAIGVEVPDSLFASYVMAPPDMRFLQARCVISTFCRLIRQGFDRTAAERSDGESARTIIQRWGFHAIDVSPCADGRLAGLLDHVLRIPPSVVAFRKSYAGALFNISDSLRHWETVELHRFRDGQPNAADAPTRFLKIGVYHFSSASPHHHGCAAHGSNDARAAGALLERLEQFSGAVRNIHGASAGIATLMVGVDTDTDAIRVHVPDAAGRMAIDRFADSLALYRQTANMAREAGKEAVRMAVAACAGVAADDRASEGMRWFCGYLLKNNIAQVDHVRQTQGGRYRDAGHSEKLIVVGDAVDDLQLRNLAFQSQMETVEEGGGDLDVGVSILRQTHDPRGLAVPVLVHFRHDPRIPGSAARAEFKARRLMASIIVRHAKLASRKKIFVQALVRATDGSAFSVLDPELKTLEKVEEHA
jgi:carboxysome shell carbonic anhydrase